MNVGNVQNADWNKRKALANMLCAYHMETDSTGHFGNVETSSLKAKLKLSRKMIYSGPCCKFHPNSFKSIFNFFLLRRLITSKYQTFFSSVMFEKHETVRNNHTLVPLLGIWIDSGPSLENSLCLELANTYVRGAWNGQQLDPKWILIEKECFNWSWLFP